MGPLPIVPTKLLGVGEESGGGEGAASAPGFQGQRVDAVRPRRSAQECKRDAPVTCSVGGWCAARGARGGWSARRACHGPGWLRAARTGRRQRWAAGRRRPARLRGQLRCHGGGAYRRCHGVPAGCAVPAAARWLAGAGTGAAGRAEGQRVPESQGASKVSGLERLGGGGQ